MPFQLQPGRYKFGWTAPDCPSVNFTMTGQTQGFTYEKRTLQTKFSAIVSDVPGDTYLVAQTDPACADWTVQIDRLGDSRSCSRDRDEEADAASAFAREVPFGAPIRARY